MKKKAYAKLNLSLNIINKNDNGYHNVSMVLQSINIYDLIKIKKNKSNNIKIFSNNNLIPTDDNNLAYKMAKLLFDLYKINHGIDIIIKKNIPISAGLAGGSADAAATLLIINKIFKLNISKERMINIASKIGSDVPFCIFNNLFHATGTGTTLTEIKTRLPKCFFLIIHPNFSVATPFMYNKIDEINYSLYTNSSYDLINEIKKGNLYNISSKINNTFELISYDLFKETKIIKDFLIENNAINAMMSGSGPTMYGIYDKYITAKKALNKAKKYSLGDYYYIAKPYYK